MPEFHRVQFEAAYVVEVVGMHEQFTRILDQAQEGLIEVLAAYRPHQDARVKSDVESLRKAALELASKIVLAVASIERLSGVRALFADLLSEIADVAAHAADDCVSIVDRFREAPVPTPPAGEDPPKSDE